MLDDVELMGPDDPRGRIIRAAIQVLDDGKPRTAEELCAAAIEGGLVPKTTTHKDVYIQLIEYIARATGRNRSPKIVQDPDRRFRRNLPLDDWPAPKRPLSERPAVSNASSLISELREAASGDDPAAYERVVCNAFAALGFAATHVGGGGMPDGYIDAPLGPLGYRAMLECKRGQNVVTDPDAAEAAKFKETYGARYAIMVGPGFANEIELSSELQTHGVAAFTNDDLAALLNANVDPAEIVPALQPGFAVDRIETLLWARDHGARKRQAVVSELVVEAGWRNQVAAAGANAPGDAPRLDVDAAMLLVDQALFDAGSKHPCTRDEVVAAFAHLTDRMTASAVWVDEHRDAIVIIRSR